MLQGWEEAGQERQTPADGRQNEEVVQNMTKAMEVILRLITRGNLRVADEHVVGI